MKNLVYAVLALAMLFFALQQITLAGDNQQMVFAMSWLCLAIFVISGNFAHFLYRPKKQVYVQQVALYKKNIGKQRQRQTVR